MCHVKRGNIFPLILSIVTKVNNILKLQSFLEHKPLEANSKKKKKNIEC
jgi:hypothetical protein